MVLKVSREFQGKKVKKVYVAPKDRKVIKAKRVKKDSTEPEEMMEPLVPKVVTVAQVSLAMWVQMAFPEKEAPSDQKGKKVSMELTALMDFPDVTAKKE